MNEITDIMKTMDWGPAPESPAPAFDWLDSARPDSSVMFIDGKWTDARPILMASFNPADQ